MSGRTFDFTETVQRNVALRQNGLCAACGEDLVKAMKKQEQYYSCHHVIPDQAGSPSNSDHKFLATEVNGVYLCHECHFKVGHGYNTTSGPMAYFGEYKYSHGKPPGSQEHALWLEQLRDLAPKVLPKFKATTMDYPQC